MRPSERLIQSPAVLDPDDLVDHFEANAPCERALLARVRVVVSGRRSMGRRFDRRTQLTTVLRAGGVSEALLLRLLSAAVGVVEESHPEVVARLKVRP